MSGHLVRPNKIQNAEKDKHAPLVYNSAPVFVTVLLRHIKGVATKPRLLIFSLFIFSDTNVIITISNCQAVFLF